MGHMQAAKQIAKVIANVFFVEGLESKGE